ncbi:hypothetical protein DB347_00315 [Opitutaceae bacterium EW11]|nr:hypothetical protein DB347_00315 [Opitutaceae bacterium EW11]
MALEGAALSAPGHPNRMPVRCPELPCFVPMWARIPPRADRKHFSPSLPFPFDLNQTAPDGNLRECVHAKSAIFP